MNEILNSSKFSSIAVVESGIELADKGMAQNK
jgi:hypothetical protein